MPTRLIVVAALAFACSASPFENPYLFDGGSPIGQPGQGSDAGDAGGLSDAGDAGVDGGCVALPNPLTANDGCSGLGPQNVTFTQNTCSVSFTIGTATTCAGTLSGGSNDTFTGSCQYASSGGSADAGCTAPVLPGHILCPTSGGGQCLINLCGDAGVCPP